MSMHRRRRVRRKSSTSLPGRNDPEPRSDEEVEESIREGGTDTLEPLPAQEFHYAEEVFEAIVGGQMRLPSVSHYEIVRQLGEGGMGSVFLADHVSEANIRRQVAIKVIKDTHDESSIEKFVEEARIMARLSKGTIVNCHALESYTLNLPGRDGREARKRKLYFMVMEYIDGPGFDEVLKRHTEDKFLCHPAIIGQVINKAAVALAEAHTLKDEDGTPLHMVHRDISPSNIMVVRDVGIVKLTDFGVARAFHDFEEGWDKRNQRIVGKPMFMSPEQLQGRAFAASDIWGLGVIGYLALTGYAPYRPSGATLRDRVDNLRRQFRYPLRSPAEVLNLEALGCGYDVQALSDILMRCLAYDMDKRPTADELHQVLENEFLFPGGPTASNWTLAAYLRLMNRSAGEGELFLEDGYENSEDAKLLCRTLRCQAAAHALRPKKASIYQADFVKAVRSSEINPCLKHDEFGPYCEGGGDTDFL